MTEKKSDEQVKEEFSAAEKEGRGQRLPKIDFSTFIFSLNSSALVHLGFLDDPGSGKKSENLSIAKQTIDILGMLEEKTRGNLLPEEENMLRHILYDLSNADLTPRPPSLKGKGEFSPLRAGGEQSENSPLRAGGSNQKTPLSVSGRGWGRGN